MKYKEFEQKIAVKEVVLKTGSGMPMLIINSLLMLAALGATVWSILLLDAGSGLLGGIMLTVGILYLCAVGPLLYRGLKVVRPNEAIVLTLFGHYIGSLKEAGFYYVHPLASALASPVGPGQPENTTNVTIDSGTTVGKSTDQTIKLSRPGRRISLKAMTLDNERQKINDRLGNPIIVGIIVVWRVTDTAKAMFNVENYIEFLSIQCDSALRNIVRLYPYDAADNEDSNEKSLRGSSVEISDRLMEEIQSKVEIAGLEVLEARITHLAYAPEIAAAMLQRQQASAIVDARQLIVEGAVGMVEMALEKLSENGVVELDEERKAAMVSNLMVVLCGNRDAQPIVNSGSLY